MKPTHLILTALLVAVPLFAAEGKKATVTGEVIDIAGYAMKDSRGDEGRAAGQFHAEGGFPLGILTEDGKVYVAVYKNPAPASTLEAANDVLHDLLGKDVVARGTLYEAAGVSVLQISVIAEM